MNLAPFLPLSPNDVMNWVKKLCFRKMNIIIEFIVQKYAQVTNFDPFKIVKDVLQDLNAQHHDLFPSDVTAETFVDFDVDVSVTPSNTLYRRRDFTSGKIGRKY